ncbi:MAG: hypothetical protein MAG431_01317 [Chloroflexi bacterium]|nr:hypothetical protein [Chloroflexota bacterium]
MPRACYPDNWVIITGIQNLVRSIVTYHITLERAYMSTFEIPMLFWRVQDTDTKFDESSVVFNWAEKIGKAIVKELPPNEDRPGFIRSKRSYTLKT